MTPKLLDEESRRVSTRRVWPPEQIKRVIMEHDHVTYATRHYFFQAYDATVLAGSYSGPQLDILIDQGRDDQFLSASQLLPDNLIAVCSEKKIPVVFRLQPVSSCSLYKVKALILVREIRNVFK